jgi:predicted transcriptional regulator
MPGGSLPALSEKILGTVWKMNAAGQKAVAEDTVRAELSATIDEFAKEAEMLQKQGFLSRVKVNEKSSLFLTALGLAILRQIEEDNLEELK